MRVGRAPGARNQACLRGSHHGPPLRDHARVSHGDPPRRARFGEGGTSALCSIGPPLTASLLRRRACRSDTRTRAGRGHDSGYQSHAGQRHYASEILGNADRAARLAALGRQGFVPVAATPINDNRVIERRNWMVVAEQTATQPVEIVVRARPGPEALAKAISEQSSQGFVCSLLWKEGLTSIVVVMSRLPIDPARRPEFDVDTIDPARINGLSGVYVGDVPYLSDGQRVIVTIDERRRPSTHH